MNLLITDVGAEESGDLVEDVLHWSSCHDSRQNASDAELACDSSQELFPWTIGLIVSE